MVSMYYVSKRMEIAGAHKLKLDYASKCENLHGHNWIITVFCKAPSLDRNGMVVDFTLIKKVVHDQLDHQTLNDVLVDINPTAENIAFWVCGEVNQLGNSDMLCYKVTVQESEGNIATFEREDEE